jgi:hypothetical protein
MKPKARGIMLEYKDSLNLGADTALALGDGRFEKVALLEPDAPKQTSAAWYDVAVGCEPN